MEMQSLSRLPVLSRDDIEKVLNSRFGGHQHSLKELPDPRSFKDMDRATERIIKAINSREKIAIVGDYDVDGVSATAIMRRFFEAIEYDIEWIIPNRFSDGYGISRSVIKRLDSPDLIITVDNGISAHDAIDECRKLGIDVIITDHHIVPKNPPNAYATINQKQLDCEFPYDEVCGAQIAWYLCASVRRVLEVDVNMKSLLEIVALAIIADIMPLLHINRAMVKSGLKILENSQSPFIVAYREFTKKSSFRAEDIAFGLAPIINSAGRVEDAQIACNYLCSNSLRDARELLEILNSFNLKRKEIESRIVQEAIESSDSSLNVVVAVGDSWSEGVVGIVASRLSREFEKPSIVLTKGRDGVYRGSGRSFGECNLFRVVSAQKGLLKRFGGHPKAIGLSVEQKSLNEFISALQKSAEKFCPRVSYFDQTILGILPLEMVDMELFDMIDRFEPFGHANKKPKFVSKSVDVVAVKLIGDGEHIRYRFRDGNHYIDGWHFKSSRYFEIGSRVDILYTIRENIFGGNRSVQLLIDKIDFNLNC